MKAFLAALTVAGALVTPVSGQIDLSGTWELTSEGPRGEVAQVVMFQQDGNALSGSIEMRGGPPGGRAGGGGGRGGGGRGMGGLAEIQDGAVDGATVTFAVVRGFGDRVFRIEYVGTIDGDTISGTMSTPRGESEFVMLRRS